MLTLLTIIAALALSAASIYCTCKAISAVCRLDLLSWMVWSQVGKAVGEVLSSLISNISDN